MKYLGKYEDLACSLSQWLADEMNGKGTAASVAIVQNDTLLAAFTAGQSGTIEPCITDLYNIGSVSKVYCAASIMRLAEQNRVDLDAPVINYLPHFQMKDPRYKFITIRMLLNHTSTLPGSNYRNIMTTQWYHREYERELYVYWRDSTLKAEPGAFSVYCNEGFELAMLIAFKR